MNTCSCMRVGPSASSETGPRTVSTVVRGAWAGDALSAVPAGRRDAPPPDYLRSEKVRLPGPASRRVERSALRQTDERRHRGADALDRLRAGGDRRAVRLPGALQPFAATLRGNRVRGERENEE